MVAILLDNEGNPVHPEPENGIEEFYTLCHAIEEVENLGCPKFVSDILTKLGEVLAADTTEMRELLLSQLEEDCR